MSDTTVLDIVRAAIPTADESLASNILWARTCFPFGPVTPRDLYEAADRWRRAGYHKLRLCEFCDRRAEGGQWLCRRCTRALKPKEAP